MSREQIGLFGGTFDPPHLGHLILASEAFTQLDLDRLLWILTPEPPHKQDQVITSVEHRLAMVQLAIQDNTTFELSRVELDRHGPDLGDSPADDRAAYDTDRGMAYVLDNREAFGLLVLDGAVNALVSVQEFGTGRFAPSTDALAWDAQRTRGVLLDGRSRDVQLLASTAERTGQATFTIIFARAKDVMRLRDRADVLLKALAGQ